MLKSPRLSALFLGALILSLPAPSIAQLKQFNQHQVQAELWHPVGLKAPGISAGGDLSFSIDLLTVPGRGIDYPITADYNSSVSLTQDASWIGLGWNFDPGSITRDVEGGAYVQSGDNSRSIFGVDIQEDLPSDVIPAQPDIYHVTIPGQGTLPFSRVSHPSFNPGHLPNETSGFVLEEHRPWKIEATQATSVSVTDNQGTRTTGRGGYLTLWTNRPDYSRFVVATDDGTRYVFEQPTLSYFDRPTQYRSHWMREVYVRAWRLVSILGADYPEHLPLIPANDAPGGWIRFAYGPAVAARDNWFEYGAGYASDRFTQNRYLTEIETPTHRAVFLTQNRVNPHAAEYEYSTASLFRKVSEIRLYSKLSSDTSAIKRVVLTQSDLFHQLPLGPRGNANSPGNNYGRLKLRQIQEYDANDVASPPYVFEYIGEETLRERSYYDPCVDHMGFVSEGLSTCAQTNDGGYLWSLKSIQYPLGGKQVITYEQDRTDENGVPYWFTDADGGILHYVARDSGYLPLGGPFSKLGGGRVKTVTHYDGDAMAFTKTYVYGKGHLSAVPAGGFKAFLDNYSPNSIVYNPSGRGKVGVFYESIDEENGDGSHIKTYYATSEKIWSPVSNTVQFMSSTGTALDHRYVLAVMYGNEGYLWGKPYLKAYYKAGAINPFREEETAWNYGALYDDHVFGRAWYKQKIGGGTTIDIKLRVREALPVRTYVREYSADQNSSVSEQETVYDSRTNYPVWKISKYRTPESTLDQWAVTRIKYGYNFYPELLRRGMYAPQISKEEGWLERNYGLDTTKVVWQRASVSIWDWYDINARTVFKPKNSLSTTMRCRMMSGRRLRSTERAIV